MSRICFTASELVDGGGGQPLMSPSSRCTSSSSWSSPRRSVIPRLPVLRLFFYLCLSRFVSVLAQLFIVFKFRVRFRMSESSVYGAHLFYCLSRTYRARPYVFIIVSMIVYRQSLVSSVHRFPVSSANAARHLRGRQAQSRTLMVHTIGPTVRIRQVYSSTCMTSTRTAHSHCTISGAETVGATLCPMFKLHLSIPLSTSISPASMPTPSMRLSSRR